MEETLKDFFKSDEIEKRQLALMEHLVVQGDKEGLELLCEIMKDTLKILKALGQEMEKVEILSTKNKQ